MKQYFFFLLILVHQLTFSQDLSLNEDSLILSIKTQKDYSVEKIESLIHLANLYAETDPLKGKSILLQAYVQAEKIENALLFVTCSRDLGVTCFYLGQLEEAEIYLIKSIEVARSNHFFEQLGEILLDLGQVEDYLGRDQLSLKHTLEGIELLEDQNNYPLMVAGYNNLGSFYYYRNVNSKAQEYYFKARDIIIGHFNLEKEYSKLAITESNIGWTYYEMGKIDDAISQLKNAVEIHEKYNKFSISSANANNSLASLYVETRKFDLATKYINIGLDIATSLFYSEGIGNANNTLGQILYEQDKYEKSIQFYLLAFDYADTLNLMTEMAKRSESLALAYSALGNHERAFEYITLSKAYQDSVSTIAAEASFEEAITKYETEKTETENALLQKQSELKDTQMANQKLAAQNKEERQFLIGGSVGLMLVLGLFFLINRNRLKTKTNKALAMQRDEIAEQKEEITDSINYAKRIQDSFLPLLKDFDKHFSESFLMYEPKDIVAGDFYVLEEIEDFVFFAAADCTGHGVPGAMVSIVCSNAIRKVLHEENVYEAGKILSRTRDIVIHQFARKGHDVNDGMDISFCALNKTTLKLSWAGANNSLWLVRKNSNELEEIKGDKQPIGGYVTHLPFTGHEVQVEKGDTIYMSTDGYPDQFGGPKSKKFKTKMLKELLLKGNKYSLDQQLAILNKEFWDWKGKIEQIDDVCVIGVRV